MKLKGIGKKRSVVFIIVVMVSLLLVHIVQAVTAEPGTDADPAVSQSYVDARINELQTKLNTLTASVNDLTVKNTALAAQLNNLPQQGQGTSQDLSQFQILELKMGQQLVTGASAEIILRGGKAIAVASKDGGLSDLTSGTGTDIQTGQDVPLNHLLLVSREDGRGLIVSSDKAWVLLKGKYSLK